MTFDEFFSTSRNEADPEPEVTMEQIREDLRKIYEQGWSPDVSPNMRAFEEDGIVYIYDGDSLWGYCSRVVFDQLRLKIVGAKR